jgi:hypothetical protein
VTMSQKRRRRGVRFRIEGAFFVAARPRRHPVDVSDDETGRCRVSTPV